MLWVKIFGETDQLDRHFYFNLRIDHVQYYMKGKCCRFKFLDKIFRDKGKSFTFIPFSLLACAVVYKKQAGMQVQLSGDSAIWYTESKCCTNPFRVSFWWLMSATNRPWHCLCNQSVPLMYNNNTNTCIV